jgi:hypothetical protein
LVTVGSGGQRKPNPERSGNGRSRSPFLGGPIDKEMDLFGSAHRAGRERAGPVARGLFPSLGTFFISRSQERHEMLQCHAGWVADVTPISGVCCSYHEHPEVI